MNGSTRAAFRRFQMHWCSSQALNEEKTLLDYIEKDEWLTEMATLRSNKHRSTTLDKELTENTGNEEVIFPSLLEAFRRYFPKVAEKS